MQLQEEVGGEALGVARLPVRAMSSNSAVVNQAVRMSCSECSRWGGPAVSSVARNTCPRWLDIPGAAFEEPDVLDAAGHQPRLLPQLADGQRGGVDVAGPLGAVPAGNSQRRRPTG